MTAAPPLPGCPAAAKIEQSSLACRGRQRRKRPHQRWAPASARTGSGRAPGRSAHPGGMDAGGQGSGRHSGGTQGEGHRGRIAQVAGGRRWQGGWERDGDAEMGGGEGAQLGGGADRGACAAAVRWAMGWVVGPKWAGMGWAGAGGTMWVPPVVGRWTSWTATCRCASRARDARHISANGRDDQVIARTYRTARDRQGPEIHRHGGHEGHSNIVRAPRRRRLNN